jgi:hypothetical protein
MDGGRDMKWFELISGTLYLLHDGSYAEFSRIGQTGLAVMHPPGEPDMQSCFAVKPDEVSRPATIEEVKKHCP